ncbi:MAG TPA: multiheme c-type cytochrome [Gemmataceae bacterium]|jgi:hypothetical protein|nr:multiheme c-type cytochrome [Gemmataceae bacterium]
MTPTRTRWLAGIAACGALAFAALLLPGGDGYAQAPKAPAGASEPLSALHCIGCHGGPDTPAYKAYAQEKRTDFVLLTEYPTWHDRDLHALAFENITPNEKGGPDGKGNLAWTMQETLKPHRPAGYQVNAAAECLTCHSVDRKPGPVLAGNVEGRFHTATGVSCEACHGLVTDEWIGRHIQTSWRDKTPAEKWDVRQVDLRDPYTRAMKCASCHVGNKAEGKFVTHEMYAAGHPPLPPFESVTFANDAPRHYMTHGENKALANMDADIAWRNFHFRKNESAETRALAIGTVATFEATMQLLADEAAATAKTGKLLDFAHFDCYACHHDLKDPSWRQKRGYRGAPGRPTMRPCSAETLHAVLQHAQSAPGVNTEKVTKSSADIRKGLIALNKGYDAQPFGQLDEIAKQASGLVGPCRALKDELAPLVYDQAQYEALYRLLADRIRNSDGKPGPDGLYIDHDTAQQTVWGLAVLQSTLRPRSGGDNKLETELDQITAFHVRGEKREPVAGTRLRTRLERIEKFDPAVFLPVAQAWLKGFEK